MQSLHERIKQIRGDMSREDFARLVGISPRALVTYEQNERTPKADLLNRICACTNVSPEWLLMGTGPAHVRALVPPSEASDSKKMGDASPIKEKQPTENTGLQKNNVGDRRPVDQEEVALQEELNSLNKELRDLLRQTGDLRVENAELRARVRDLERELKEALKPEERSAPVASAG